MKSFALILAAATAMASSAAKQPGPAAKRPATGTLTVLYTASARGQIRSCNCTKFRFGGYGREASLVRSIRSQSPNVVLIEGGDALEWTGFQAEYKTDVVAKALALMGYGAMVPGEDELSRNASPYMRLFDRKAVPIISANYHKGGSAEPTYQRGAVVKTQGGLKVGVIGLLSQSVGRLFQEADFAAAVKDTQQALQTALAEVRPKCDFVLVVYHGPTSEAEKITSVKGVDVVISTHRTSRDVLFPQKGAESNEVEAPVQKRGSAILVNAETNMNWSLGRIDLEFAGGKVKDATHKLLYLDRRYDEDPQMVKIYDTYNEKVKQAVLTESARFKKDAEAMLVKRGLNLQQLRARIYKSPFVTADKCKDCHPEIHRIWADSRHAKAMDTLKKTNQEFDPECIGCHATGVMVRNGFANMKDTPNLANVQCEACHGPAATHVTKPAKGFGPSGEHTCRACHTDERTPDFSYDQEWAKIMH